MYNIICVCAQLSSLRSEYSAAVAGLECQLRESREQCSELRSVSEQQLQTLDRLNAELASAVRERENLETALSALREEVSGRCLGGVVMIGCNLPAVCDGVQSP